MKNKYSKIKNRLAGRYLSPERPGNQKNIKDLELSIFLEFVLRLKVDKSKIAINTDSEAPDLIVSIDGQKIGVEITTFYTDRAKKGSKGNTFFESWRKFSEELNFELNKQAIGHWYGAVHFFEPFNFLELDKKQLLEEIISLAKKYLSNSNETNLAFKPTIDSYASKYINYIYCENTSPLTDCLWWHSSLQSGSVSTKDITSKIIEICREKDKKLFKAYKSQTEKITENWLVIFARGAHLWEKATLVDSFLNRHDQDKILREQRPELDKLQLTSIKRVFVWNKHPEAIWEITPNRHVIFHQDDQGHLLRINKVPEIFQKVKL